jgi:hypothetical protein
MAPFVGRFPELGMKETRTVATRNSESVPDGEYAFVELYCNEPGCDCRRVFVQVLRGDTGWSRIWATINYGWEDLDFYRRWGHGSFPEADLPELKGPSLAAMAPQSKYADFFLGMFRSLLAGPGYAQRLQKHYEMFRAAIDSESAGSSRHQHGAAKQQRLRKAKKSRRR